MRLSPQIQIISAPCLATILISRGLTFEARCRFWLKVKIGNEGECWLWEGGKDKDGYGLFTFNHHTVRVPRLMWMLRFGQIEPGKFVCHACDNPICCNPAHFFLGTNQENVIDAVKKGRIKRKGDFNGRALLNSTQVLEIRSLHPTATPKQLAKNYGVSACAIYDVLTRKTWSHI